MVRASAEGVAGEVVGLRHGAPPGHPSTGPGPGTVRRRVAAAAVIKTAARAPPHHSKCRALRRIRRIAAARECVKTDKNLCAVRR